MIWRIALAVFVGALLLFGAWAELTGRGPHGTRAPVLYSRGGA